MCLLFSVKFCGFPFIARKSSQNITPISETFATGSSDIYGSDYKSSFSLSLFHMKSYLLPFFRYILRMRCNFFPLLDLFI